LLPAVEAAEDVADEDELELVLDIEEEDVTFDWDAYESGYWSPQRRAQGA